MEIYQTSFLPKPNLTEITHDLASKLNLHHPNVEDPSPLSEDHLEEHQPQLQGNDAGEQEVEEEEEEEREEEEDDDDFSFCCGRSDGSPVSAEDIFADGIIRPVFPLFNQSLLLSGEPGAIYPFKRVVFVGDSIGRNQWESLLCMLSTGVSDPGLINEVNGSPITKHKGHLIFKFGEFNCTVEYYRAPFLVLQSRPPSGLPEGLGCT